MYLSSSVKQLKNCKKYNKYISIYWISGKRECFLREEKKWGEPYTCHSKLSEECQCYGWGKSTVGANSENAETDLGVWVNQDN